MLDQPGLAPTFHQSVTHTTQERKTIVKIPVKLWRELLEVIKTEDINAMVNSVETINKHVVVTVNNKPEKSDEFSRTVNTCNVVKRSFECGEQLQALMACSFTTGLPQSVLQAVQVIPKEIPVCCIQHRRRPVECFCEEAKTPARER